MRFDSGSVSTYFIAFFVAWAVGYVFGMFMSWLRGLFGDVANSD